MNTNDSPAPENAQEVAFKRLEKGLYAVRLSMEALRLHKINHDKLMSDTVDECQRLGLSPEQTLTLVANAAKEIMAIHNALSHFVNNPNLIQNPNYTWEDHCQTIQDLKSLAYPESEPAKARKDKLSTVPVLTYTEAIYRRFEQLVAEPNHE